MLRASSTPAATPDDGWPTHSWREQRRVEDIVADLLEDYEPEPSPVAVPMGYLAAGGDASMSEVGGSASVASSVRAGHLPTATESTAASTTTAGDSTDDGACLLEDVELARAQHVRFLLRALRFLSQGYESLDASRPWITYWICNSLCLLGHALDTQLKSEIAQFLGCCQSPAGGFAGGPGQMPHLAPTYAAICTLATLGTEEAYDVIDRPGLYAFLMSCKTPSGGFVMHHDGEVDVRGTYCALHAAYMCHLLTPELAEGAGDFVASCQTWDGGIGAIPGNEAHGGYTYCGLAAMALLSETYKLDIARLIEWACSRQMTIEGGFQGRTNKLVDGCYSFWQGGVFPVLSAIIDGLETQAVGLGSYRPSMMYQGDGQGSHTSTLMGDMLMHQEALQDYVLIACQDHRGGLRDKPGKPRDLYHTCYCLSGLSVAQHNIDGSLTFVGVPENVLHAIEPVLAVERDRAHDMWQHFQRLPSPPFTIVDADP